MTYRRFLASLAIVAIACSGCVDSRPAPTIDGSRLQPPAIVLLDDPADQACQAKGGTPTTGLLAERLCQVKTTDAGKACTNWDQCQGGTCVAGYSGEEGSPAVGECPADNINLGCPLYHVIDGKLAIDCAE
jgi:hypothetical protein